MTYFVLFLILIIFRLAYIAFIIFLLCLIFNYVKGFKKNKAKKYKNKLIVISIVLFVCIFFGYTELPARVNIKKDNVTEIYAYVEQNNDEFKIGQRYNIGNMFGWVSYWETEATENLLKEINMTEEERKETNNWYPTYVFYDEVDNIEIYYEEAKCTRWESLGHFNVDLLGVLDYYENSISTKVYLISNKNCVVINVNYNGCYPYSIYTPEIDFQDIVSNLRAN